MHVHSHVTCHMCLYCDLFQEGYALACGHVYHTACITTYADVAKLPMTHIRCPKCKRTSVDVEGAELDEDGALPHESGDMVEFLLGGRGSRSSRGTSTSSGATATVMMPQSPDIYVMNPLRNNQFLLVNQHSLRRTGVHLVTLMKHSLRPAKRRTMMMQRRMTIRRRMEG